MKVHLPKLVVISLFVSVLTISLSGAASAHVVVKPAEVVTAGFQTFSIGVPNEKEIPTTTIKLTIPDGLKYVSPTVKSGWQINVEKDGTGKEATVKAIIWSGGSIGQGLRDDFTFSAQVPTTATNLQWKAYQTYSDGTTVSWDKESHGDGHDQKEANSGPLSVTKVVSETAQTSSLKKAEQATVSAQASADRALYAGIAGIVLGLGCMFTITRRKK